MNKLIRDDKVAVLYSPGFGAGWYTWNKEHEDMVFDPVLATLIDEGKTAEAETYVAMRWPDVYAGGLEDLTVAWVPVGAAFTIDEYDGNESIQLKERVDWLIA